MTEPMAGKKRLSSLYTFGLPVVAVVYLGLSLLAALVSSRSPALSDPNLQAQFAFWQGAIHFGGCMTLPVMLSAGVALLLWLVKRGSFWQSAAKAAFWVLLTLLPLAVLSMLISAFRQFAG